MHESPVETHHLSFQLEVVNMNLSLKMWSLIQLSLLAPHVQGNSAVDEGIRGNLIMAHGGPFGVYQCVISLN